MSMPKVVILCGGQGTRLKELTDSIPKPMAPLGGKPILWHIMKAYAHYGFKDFVLALGYKADVIKRYFLEYDWLSHDVTIEQHGNEQRIRFHAYKPEEWTITMVDTGENTLTGARIKLLKKYLENDEHFMCTYGDGVSDVDIRALYDFHKKHGKIATLTGVKPVSKYGQLIVDGDDITGFRARPQLNDLINGGFQVFNRAFLDMVDDGMIEDPFPKLAEQNQITVFKHDGFWQSMDTYQDFTVLNKMWDEGKRPWVVWHD